MTRPHEVTEAFPTFMWLCDEHKASREAAGWTCKQIASKDDHDAHVMSWLALKCDDCARKANGQATKQQPNFVPTGPSIRTGELRTTDGEVLAQGPRADRRVSDPLVLEVLEHERGGAKPRETERRRSG